MAAGNYDILIEQGATFEITLTLKDVNAVPINLTGLTFRGKIRKAFTDVAAVANFTFAVQDQTSPSTVGKVIVSLSATTTAALETSAKGTVRTLTTMVYDIESENPLTGFVTRWLQGQAMVSPEVTK
jgi:hypothetical protein